MILSIITLSRSKEKKMVAFKLWP